MATSDYVESDFQSFSTNLPTVVNIPPIRGITSIAYNGEYWMAVGKDSVQIRKIYSYSDVFTKVEYSRVLNATLKSISSYRHTLKNTNPTLYSTAISNLNTEYASKNNSYKSMLSAAAAKFKYLQSLGYNTQPQTIKTLHNMMRSKDGFTWEIVEDNPFQYYDRSLLVGEETDSANMSSPYYNLARVNDIKWNSTLKLWVAVGKANVVWTGGPGYTQNAIGQVSAYDTTAWGGTITITSFSAPDGNGIQTVSYTPEYDHIALPGYTITITGASNSLNTLSNATVISSNGSSNPRTLTVLNPTGVSGTGQTATGTYVWNLNNPVYSYYGGNDQFDNNGQQIGSSQFGPRTCIATSPDGLVWTSRGMPIVGLNVNSSSNSGFSALKVACSVTTTIIIGMFAIDRDNINNYVYEYMASSTDCINWSIIPKATANIGIEPKGIAYNGALWVIVGERLGSNTDYIQTSTNGTTWTSRFSTATVNGTYDFRNVAWNGKKWIAVGSRSTSITELVLMASDDGFSWSVIKSIDTNNFISFDCSIAFDGNLWIITSEFGNYTTPNGTTLTPITNVLGTAVGTNIPLPILGGTISIVTSLLVGYGSPMSVLRSYDNANWIPQLIDGEGTNFLGAPQKEFFGIVWCDTFWVIVGNPQDGYLGRSLATSSDGITWSYPTTWSGTLFTPVVTAGRDVAWDGTMAIAVGQGNVQICTSTNGTTWTTRTSPLDGCNAIAWNGRSTTVGISNFAATSNGTQVITVTSTTGIVAGQYITITNATNVKNNGTFLVTAIGSGTITCNNTIGVSGSESSSVTFGYTGLWIIGGNGGLAISVNGTTWTKISSVLDVVYNIAWNGYVWLAVGSGVAHSIAISVDGVHWYFANPDTNPFTQCNAVAWNKSLWVAVGNGENTIATSVDGYVWTPLGTTAFGTSGTMVAWDGSKWIAGGLGYYPLASSTDGTTWTRFDTSLSTVNCYANKTIALPYTGALTTAIEQAIQARASAVGTSTNSSAANEQLNIQIAADQQAAAAAAAAALVTRNATKTTAADYVIKFLYWKQTIAAQFSLLSSGPVGNAGTEDIYNINFLEDTDNRVGFLTVKALSEKLNFVSPDVLNYYTNILNDNNSQSVLDGNLTSIISITNDYTSDLLEFYNTARVLYNGVVNEVAAFYNGYDFDSFLTSYGLTSSTPSTKSSVLSAWNGYISSMNSAKTTANTLFGTALSSVTYSITNSNASLVGITDLNTLIGGLSFTIISFSAPVNNIQTITGTDINVYVGYTVQIVSGQYSANQGTRTVLSVNGNTFTVSNPNGVASSVGASANGPSVTVLSQITSNAPNLLTTYNAFSNGASGVYGLYVFFYQANVYKQQADQYKANAITSATKWATVIGSGTVSITSFSAPSNGVQTITVTAIGGLAVGRGLTITGSSNVNNNVTAYVIGISGNTFTISNPNGVSITGSALGTYGSVSVPITAINNSFAPLFNKYYYTLTNNLPTYLDDKPLKYFKIAYNAYGHPSGFPDQLAVLYTSLKGSLDNLDAIKTDAINYAKAKLADVRVETGYFNSITRRTYPGSEPTISTHLKTLLNLAFTSDSRYTTAVNFSNKILAGSIAYPYVYPLISGIDTAIANAEDDGCKPPQTGWGGATQITTTLQRPGFTFNNPDGVAYVSTNTDQITGSFIVANISAFEKPNTSNFQTVVLSSNQTDFINIQPSRTITITGASNSANNVTSLIYSLIYPPIAGQTKVISCSARSGSNSEQIITVQDIGTIQVGSFIDIRSPTDAGNRVIKKVVNITGNKIIIFNLRGVQTSGSSGLETTALGIYYAPGSNIKFSIYNANGVVGVQNALTPAIGKCSVKITEFSAVVNGVQTVTVDTLNDFILNGNTITTSGAPNSGNNKSLICTNTLQLQSKSVPTPNYNGPNGWVYVPGYSQGLSGWTYYNEVFYAFQRLVDHQAQHTINGRIAYNQNVTVTISGASNSINNGTRTITGSFAYSFNVFNPTGVAATGQTATGTCVFGINTFSAPVSGIQTITATTIGVQVGRLVSISGSSVSGNNVSNKTVLSVTGYTFTISNSSGGAAFQQTATGTGTFPITAFSAPSGSGSQLVSLNTDGIIHVRGITVSFKSTWKEFLDFTNTSTYDSFRSEINTFDTEVNGVSANNGFTQSYMNGLRDTDVAAVVAQYVSSGTSYLNDLANNVNKEIPASYTLTITGFSAPSNGIQTITTSSIGTLQVYSSITITNASNSNNNGVRLVVLSISGNTFTVSNSNGVSGTGETATGTYGDLVDFGTVTFNGSASLSAMVSSITSAYNSLLALKNTGITSPPSNVTASITAFSALVKENPVYRLPSIQTVTVSSIGNIKVGLTLRITGASSSGNNGIFKVLTVDGNTFTIRNPSGVAGSQSATATYSSVDYTLTTAEEYANTVYYTQTSTAYSTIIKLIPLYRKTFNNALNLVTRMESNMARWRKMKPTAIAASPYKINYTSNSGKKFIMSIPPTETGYWTQITGTPFKTIDTDESLSATFSNGVCATIPPYDLNAIAAYSSTDEYTRYQLVKYNSKVYECIKDNSSFDLSGIKGVTPASTDNWIEIKYPTVTDTFGNIVEADPKNLPALNSRNFPTYTPTAKYSYNDYVSVSDTVFRCIYDFKTTKKVKNIPPSNSSLYWIKRTYPVVLYNNSRVEANPANFPSLATSNNTPDYDSTKTYTRGNTVKYNGSYYFLILDQGKFITGIAPGSNVPYGGAWASITYPMVYAGYSNSGANVTVDKGTGNSFVQCTSSNFSVLSSSNFTAYSSATLYASTTFVSYNGSVYECAIQTPFTCSISPTNTLYWKQVKYPVVVYNGSEIEFTPGSIPPLSLGNYDAYNNTYIYNIDDIVSFNGSIYKCIFDTPTGYAIKNIPPTVTAYWEYRPYPLVIIDNEEVDGDPTSGNFVQLNELDYHMYENNWFYYEGDIVSYNGNIYKCTNADYSRVTYTDSLSGKSPITDSGYWTDITTENYVNNTYYKPNNIVPWDAINTRSYEVGSLVLWKGYIYKCETAVAYQSVIDLNDPVDVNILSGYIPSRNETIWKLQDTNTVVFKTTIPKYYSNTETYRIGNQVMINDFPESEDVLTSIITPFRVRVFQLTKHHLYEPVRYTYPQCAILNDLDSDGSFKTGVIRGNWNTNGLPRYGEETDDPFKIPYFAADLKKRVLQTVTFPYSHIKYNTDFFSTTIAYSPWTISGELHYLEFYSLYPDPGYNFNNLIIKPPFASSVYDKVVARGNAVCSEFNNLESSYSIRAVLKGVYSDVILTLQSYKDEVVAYQLLVNNIKQSYFQTQYYRILDDPWPYLNVVGLAQSPPKKYFRDLGVGDIDEISYNIDVLHNQLKSSEAERQYYYENTAKIEDWTDSLTQSLLRAKWLVNYTLMANYKFGQIGVEFSLPIDYYNIDGYYNKYATIDVGLFILGEYDLQYRQISGESGLFNNSQTDDTVPGIINIAMTESIRPAPYTLPGGDEGILEVVTFQSKDPFVIGLSAAAKGIVGLTAAAFQSAYDPTQILGAIEFIGNWAISGKPDGEVTADMPGGNSYMQTMSFIPKISWPSFNERAQSITAVKTLVAVYRNSLILPEPPPDNQREKELGQFLTTVGKLLYLCSDAFDDFKDGLVQELPRYETETRSVRITKKITIPPVDARPPDFKPKDPTPPKPTKGQLAHGNLLQERDALRKLETDIKNEIRKLNKLPPIDSRYAVNIPDAEYTTRAEIVKKSGPKWEVRNANLTPAQARARGLSGMVDARDSAGQKLVAAEAEPPRCIHEITNQAAIDRAIARSEANQLLLAEAKKEFAEQEARRAALQEDLKNNKLNKARVLKGIKEVDLKNAAIAAENDAIIKANKEDVLKYEEQLEIDKQKYAEARAKHKISSAKARAATGAIATQYAELAAADKNLISQTKLTYEGNVATLQYKKTIYVQSLVDNPTFAAHMKTNVLPSTMTELQYFKIKDPGQISNLDAIEKGYRRVLFSVTDYAGKVQVYDKFIKARYNIFPKSIVPTKLQKLFGMAGPLLEIVGVGVTAYSMGAFNSEVTLLD